MLVIPIMIHHSKDTALAFFGLRIKSVLTKDIVAENESILILFWN